MISNPQKKKNQSLFPWHCFNEKASCSKAKYSMSLKCIWLLRIKVKICLTIFVMFLSLCARFSRAQLFVIPWTVACQAPLTMGFSRQEHWSGLPRPPPGDLLDPGIEPESSLAPEFAGEFFTTEPPGRPYVCIYRHIYRASSYISFSFF